METNLTEADQAAARSKIATMISTETLDFGEIVSFYEQYEQFRPTNDPEETIE